MAIEAILSNVCWNNIDRCVHVKDSTTFCGRGKQCLCACIIDSKDKNSGKILSFGYNKYNIDNRTSIIQPSNIHAEVDCCMKLRTNNTSKKIKVNLIVFRSNPKKNKLLLAKPCLNCINTINYLIHKKGYILKGIYYTDNNGNICGL